VSPRGDISDDEEPSDEDIEPFGDENDTDLATCPHCGADVYDDADRCGQCGMNIIRGHNPGDHRPALNPTWPVWIILAALVTAAAILFCYVF
jgi:hypothetical protein